MPKILHVIGQLIRGGAERQLLLVAEALARRGFEQTIVTLNPGAAWDRRVAELGAELVGIPRSWNKLARLARLSRIMALRRADVIHSWSEHTSLYCHWAALLRRSRHIASFRLDPCVDQVSGRAAARVAHGYVYERAAGVVSNSQGALDAALESGLRLKRSWVVGNIVVSPGRGRPGEATRPTRIVAAGRLVQRKGFDVLLKALARLEPPANDFKLELAGDGPEREVLRSLAADLGLADRVEFLGEVDDVPSHFAQAQLLVHPSFSEGLSNTILEAMAEGLPVIATSVGATAEYIEPGRTGALVPPGNVEALASALTELLRAPEARGRMGVAALESVRSRCSMDVVTAQYEAVYNELLDGLASARTPVSAQS